MTFDNIDKSYYRIYVHTVSNHLEVFALLLGLAGVVALLGGGYKALATDGMTSAFWYAVAIGGGVALLLAAS